MPRLNFFLLLLLLLLLFVLHTRKSMFKTPHDALPERAKELLETLLMEGGRRDATRQKKANDLERLERKIQDFKDRHRTFFTDLSAKKHIEDVVANFTLPYAPSPSVRETVYWPIFCFISVSLSLFKNQCVYMYICVCVCVFPR